MIFDNNNEISGSSNAEKVSLDDLLLSSTVQEKSDNGFVFHVPELEYDYQALHPYIDSQTMELHITKHHKGYVKNLNLLVEEYKDSIGNKEIIEMFRYAFSINRELNFASKLSSSDSANKIKMKNMCKGIRKYAGGHVNHSMLWHFFSPFRCDISNSLKNLLSENFGSLENFKELFTSKAVNGFGSYWIWLTVENMYKGGKLRIVTTQNQDNPLMFGQFPILGLDMWEHAYYIGYFNDKESYAKNFWNIVNWDYVSKLYSNFTSGTKRA